METTVTQLEGNQDNQSRKYGFPEWMLHNIERLNSVTDFEQYACSPPETEGFLAEYTANSDCSDIDIPLKFTGTESCEQKSTLGTERHSPNRLTAIPSELSLASTGINVQSPVSRKHHSILDAIKCEDALYSSPESTPEPSPALQRKIGFISPDTVQSNPKKWFYLGENKDVCKLKLKRVPGKQNKYGKVGEAQVIDVGHGKNDTSHISDGNHVKLAISNFDINAISPSSW